MTAAGQADPVSAALTAAAESIDRNGWAQGAGWIGGRRCVAIAIGETATNGDLYEAAMDRFEAVVGSEAITWNDTPGRTQGEVVAALRTAAQVTE